MVNDIFLWSLNRTCIFELLVDAARFVPKLGLAVDFQERGRDWQSHPLPAMFPYWRTKRSMFPKLKAKKIPKARERMRKNEKEWASEYASLASWRLALSHKRFISADPGLGQGRGRAWDHRRCGTSPSSLSKVKPISQPASCPKATSRQHFPGMLRPPVNTCRHLDIKITCFGKPLKRWLGMLHPAANSHPEATHQWLLMGRLRAFGHENNMLWETLKTLTWHASSCSQQPPQGYHQWLLMGRLNNPLACFILQPTGTPRPHINGFLWASNSAVCQPLNPLKPSKPLKTLRTLKTLPWHASSCSQQPPQGHTSMAAYGPLKQSLCITIPWHASSCSQQAPQGHTSMASYGRPSLPFASP